MLGGGPDSQSQTVSLSKDEAIQAAQAKVEDKVQALNAGMPMIGLGSVAMGASMVLLF